MDSFIQKVKILVLLLCVVHNAAGNLSLENVTQVVETRTTTSTVQPIKTTVVETTITSTVKPVETTRVVETSSVRPIETTVAVTTIATTLNATIVTANIVTTTVRPIQVAIVNATTIVANVTSANETSHVTGWHVKNITSIATQNVTATTVACTNKTFVLFDNLLRTLETRGRCLRRFYADLDKFDTHLSQKMIELKKDYKYGNLIIMMKRLLHVLNTTVTSHHRANESLTAVRERPVVSTLFQVKRPIGIDEPARETTSSEDESIVASPSSYNFFWKLSQLQLYRPYHAAYHHEEVPPSRRPDSDHHEDKESNDHDDDDDEDDDERRRVNARPPHRLYHAFYYNRRHE
jgi:hypothetical protein